MNMSLSAKISVAFSLFFVTSARASSLIFLLHQLQFVTIAVIIPRYALTIIVLTSCSSVMASHIILFHSVLSRFLLPFSVHAGSPCRVQGTTKSSQSHVHTYSFMQDDHDADGRCTSNVGTFPPISVWTPTLAHLTFVSLCWPPLWQM